MQNFCVSAAEAQLQMESLFHPDGSPTGAKQTLDILNIVFTFIFTIELLVNMLSQTIREFIVNGWSIFDTVVVLMSLIVLGPLDFPMSMLRALRVVRLFGRLKSSKKILSALSVSLIPMCNAFFIMLIVAMMCEFSESPSVASAVTAYTRKRASHGFSTAARLPRTRTPPEETASPELPITTSPIPP
jgi:hypothetical protein